MSNVPYRCDPLHHANQIRQGLEELTTGELRALIEELNIALYTKLIKSKE